MSFDFSHYHFVDAWIFVFMIKIDCCRYKSKQHIIENMSNIPLVHAEEVAATVIEAHSVMSRCNHGKDVYKFIHTGNKYVIEMPEINTILNVTCTFAARRAADMYIDTVTVNGERDSGSETCTISYDYDNFDSIYYTSFAKPDACIVYSY